MRRSRVGLDEVASWHTLGFAFWRAARGKRRRPEVAAFERNLDENLGDMQQALFTGTYRFSPFRCFEIHDPKRRVIHAPAFADRVVHHALVAHIGPVLERALVSDTFACRLGKGTLAAVLRAQQQSRRYRWYVKTDIRNYFGSICHDTVRSQLRRRFKNEELLTLCDTVLDAYHREAGLGLPIGALTSQYFANHYLDGLDRLLLEQLRVGMVRYMDDVVWWGDDRAALRESVACIRSYLADVLHLELKRNWQLQRTGLGMSFCGFRVYPDRLGLTPRKKRRYVQARNRWETHYRLGWVPAAELQAGYSAAVAVIAHADTDPWRKRDLTLRPPVDA